MSVYFYFVLLGVSISAEVITLIKDQNVTCVISGESVYSAIAVVPRVDFKRPVDIIEAWSSTLEDQWKYCDGTQCAENFDIITDQRWEGFETQCSNSNNNHKGFLKLKEYGESISIYSDSITTYYNITDIKKTPLETNRNLSLSPGQWNYYTIKKSGKSVEIQGDESQNLQFNSTPYWISFSDNMCRKLHRYIFLYSNSSGESSIIINSTNCIFMYVSIDQDCFLDVQFAKGNSNISKTIDGFNQNKTFRTWETFKITNNFNGSGYIHLHKRIGTNKSDECYWAIAEMQKCRNNSEIHHVPFRNDSHKDEQLCKTLRTNNKSKNTQNIFSVNNKKHFLNENPPLTCSDVLGKSYPNCDNYIIYVENGTRFCGWGYTGRFCNETCKTGFWGLNCTVSCGICETCDPIKGCTKCKENFTDGDQCQTCKTGFWGSNCILSCGSKCNECDHIKGCTQCSESFYGSQCENKKPVLKKTPTLLKIINDSSLTFTQNMDYGKDEVQPDLFQIEYRSILNGNNSQFSTYGNKTKYENKEQNFTLHGLSLATSSYEIRIILFADSTENTTNNVPSLLVHQRTLNMSVSNNSLLITWKNLHINKTLFNNYLLFYECQKCENEIIKDTITTKNLSATIENTQLVETCYINLKSEINETATLLDEIEIKLNKTTLICETKGSKNVSRISKAVTESTKKSAKTNEPLKTKRLMKSSVLKLTVIVASLVVVLITTTIIIICIFKRRRNKKQNHQPPRDLDQKSHEMYPLVEKANNLSNSNIVELSEFENYLLQALEENPDDNYITQQYEAISKMLSKNRKSGQLAENKDKNRYRNIIAYDDTRVILKTDSGESNYINANYIDGYHTPRAFIATQAPLPSTLTDFWLMICQEKATTIIMLTELREGENGIVKCEQYWPEPQSRCRFGKFQITNVSQKVFPNYIVRQLQVSYDNQTHFLQHFQYITWPDHGVPLYTQDYIEFLKKIMRLPQKAPIVVHCNAGCGRTGAFILSDIAIRMAIHENRVDLPKLLSKMREQRQGLVSNIEQYIFVHTVILEYFFRKDFSIPVSKNFQYDIQKAMDKESLQTLMEYLEKVTKQLKKTRFKYFLQLTDEDKLKNRFPNLVPGISRVFLPISTSDSSNYINAISVDCYRCSKKFIVTQQPLPNTLEDFWTLIKEYDIDTIISLNEIPENDPTCPIFWPRDPYEAWLFGNDLKVTFQNQSKNDLYKTIKVKFDVDRRAVRIIDVKGWKREALTPKSLKDLIRIWKKVMSGTNQIVVTCYDGTTASGLFVALVFLLEKLNMDHVCDVFSAVKTVRESRLEFVQHPNQLTFLYNAALEYIREFSTYGNFN